MKILTEITQWNLPYELAGHTYFVSDSKDKAYAYVKSGGTQIEPFKKPYSFGTGGRKFREVANTWGFVPPEPAQATGGTTRQVPGTGGQQYTITEHLGRRTCTCAGFRFRADCRHLML